MNTTTRQGALLLLGPTGSGKTPLGEIIAQRGLARRRCVHFDFGAQMRRIAAAGEPEGPLSAADVAFIADVLRSGALLEDEHFHIARGILAGFRQRLRVGPDTLVVLNGLPRHVGQAAALDESVAVEWLVELVCSAEDVAARIRGNTGGDRAQRSDDSPAEVARKLAIYEQRTRPLVEHYRSRGVQHAAIPVTAATPPDDAYMQLCRCFGN